MKTTDQKKQTPADELEDKLLGTYDTFHDLGTHFEQTKGVPALPPPEALPGLVLPDGRTYAELYEQMTKKQA